VRVRVRAGGAYGGGKWGGFKLIAPRAPPLPGEMQLLRASRSSRRSTAFGNGSNGSKSGVGMVPVRCIDEPQRFQPLPPNWTPVPGDRGEDDEG
jgi:hypothetical protein